MQANFDEARQSQLPAVELLVNMGYTYLSRAEIQRLRGDDNSKFILKDIAFESLKRINHFEHNGVKYPFSDKNIVDAIDELENIPLNGLQDTAKDVYHMMMTSGGKTIREMIDGKLRSHNFRFIDFVNPRNNSFHVAVEFPVNGKKENIRPDIVCFVNGIPFVVIENKKTGIAVIESLKQMNRYQRPEYAPKFFVYPQVLIGTNVSECLYGTTGTPNKFYAKWKEKGDGSMETKDFLSLREKEIQTLIQKPIETELYKIMCSDMNGATNYHRQLMDRLTTPQDQGLYGVLRPERLLSLTQHFILFDEGTKKIARYQQYFAIQKMLKRVRLEEDETKREGGIVWHTQGSGKSLTMVLFVKAIIEDHDLINPRVIIVTDRVDLDRQISNTFRNCNLKKKVIQTKTGTHLLDLIKEKNPAVITSLVHKFDTAAKKRSNFVDTDQNIFVLIDEAHRTQNGLASEEMRRIIPNACFIGFTGTPLLKKDKSQNRFGGFIDKYTIDDALEDEIVLPLIYQGRYAEMNQNKEKVDRHIERITKDLNNKSVKELQRFINTKVIKNNPHRITEIAYDIEDHFRTYFQGTGLKAQIVAPSKYSAILFHKIFEEGLRLKTAVIISEAQIHEDETDDHKKDVAEFLKEKAANYKNLESYEKDVIESFKHNPDGIEIIIVVDKLLTGFDAPRNTVLYLTKDLKDHNLLQAIARVNRLFDNKERPKTSGFIVDYSENAQNIKSAMELFGNYDEEDVKSTLIDTNQKISELEQSYGELEGEFKMIKNKKDSQSYLEFLGDEKCGEQRRNEFYKNFNNFLKNLDECMSLRDFSEKFKHLDTYKKELKRYAELRKSSQFNFADKLDLSEYKTQLVKILDEYIDAEKVDILTEQININDSDAFEKALEMLGSTKSKAEAIAAQTKRVITEKEDTDPEFYRRFSEKIRDILKKLREGKMADLEALKVLRGIQQQVVNKEDDLLPEVLKDSKGADIFYRNLKGKFKSLGVSDEILCKIILDIFSILKKETIIDWHHQTDTQRIIKNKLDDYLYDEVKMKMKVDLTHEDLAYILEKVLNLALENHELF
ncbi:MAG: HsdR family type I site-specific deoxyribonuclease [Candidatus Peregrinibacteria bacterium]|nr:HsdR family type I site-specific deoxyribonuclease [Candidatus Peregrinibacteria bacterium]